MYHPAFLDRSRASYLKTHCFLGPPFTLSPPHTYIYIYTHTPANFFHISFCISKPGHVFCFNCGSPSVDLEMPSSPTQLATAPQGNDTHPPSASSSRATSASQPKVGLAATPRSIVATDIVINQGEEDGDFMAAKWFSPSLTREAAETLLAQQPPGTFLVRASQGKPGSFGLCIKGEDKVFHFLVNHNGSKFFSPLSLL